MLELCAMVAVLLSTVAVSVLWLRVVPLLQSPDEQAHFDYVYALARSGQPLRAADGPPRYSPTDEALIREVGFWRIIFHNTEPIDPAYGSAAYMQHLEQAVPQTPPSFYEGKHHPVPSLTSVYPFGGYGLIALVAAAAGGSPVHMLFAARAACIGFAVMGLLFGYLALRELGLRRSSALPLLAAMGFFPLMSFVSSYVQPDNVALGFTSLTLYAAIRLRRRPAERASFALYAVALMLLVATKYQYALAVGVATLPYVVLRVVRAFAGPAARALATLALLLPSAAALALTWWYSQGTDYLSHGALTHNLGGPSSFTWLGGALVNYFEYGVGTTAMSYWGLFGWLDTRLQIRPDWLALAFGSCINWGTWAIILATAVLVVRNLGRIAHAARARGAATGVRLVFGDPLVNAYLLFALLMIALYVSSANAFAAQGRNWLPFLPSAFALGVVYAPKVLPRRARALGGRVVLGFLVAFAAFGSYWSVIDVVDRYYHPSAQVVSYPFGSLAQRPWGMRGAIDQCTIEGGRLIVRGWFVDQRVHRPAAAAAILVDGRLAGWASFGGQRPDVAAALGDDAYTYSGYGADLPAPRAHGTHRVTVAPVEPDGLAYEISPQQSTVVRR